ncbi:ABC-type multidrug transport system ATPase subunit [Methanolinea mesophila]|uniref:ATP-binding cassette domain-containing protein n=1 Tax=Methanolinea mesophila TaxID=547055 RepID=UPI001AEB375D|nr:ATP-binding cassette domain-containing protein [Methanolinea mesophila]MBP1927921.1 ABC-type multidrug transport system ATPase subunit [Methanolinea mesophila]
MIPAVAVESLAYTYPGGKGVRDLTFTVDPGEICCIYGKNGTGKSTLFNVLSTTCRPSGGRFLILGADGDRERETVRARIFPVFDENSHFENVNGWDNLEFFKKIYALTKLDDSDRIFKILDLDPSGPAGSYSLGMKRKLMLAESLVSGKPVLLYDEPSLGLDSDTRTRFFSLAGERAREGAAVLYGTNRISEIRHGDRIFHLTGEGLKEVGSVTELEQDLIPVTISTGDQVFTEHLERIEDLPPLIAKMLPFGVPRTIEVFGDPGATDEFWTRDAEEKVSRAPAFVRPMVRKLVEKYARDKGYSRITVSVVDEARTRFEKR